MVIQFNNPLLQDQEGCNILRVHVVCILEVLTLIYFSHAMSSACIMFVICSIISTSLLHMTLCFICLLYVAAAPAFHLLFHLLHLFFILPSIFVFTAARISHIQYTNVLLLSKRCMIIRAKFKKGLHVHLCYPLKKKVCSFFIIPECVKLITKVLSVTSPHYFP